MTLLHVAVRSLDRSWFLSSLLPDLKEVGRRPQTISLRLLEAGVNIDAIDAVRENVILF